MTKAKKPKSIPRPIFFGKGGIPTKIDANHAIANNKIMIIDGENGCNRVLQLHESRRGKERRKSIDQRQSLSATHVKYLQEDTAHSGFIDEEEQAVNTIITVFINNVSFCHQLHRTLPFLLDSIDTILFLPPLSSADFDAPFRTIAPHSRGGGMILI